MPSTFMIDWPDAAIRITVAVLVGLLVGLERERQDRPAGFRTHALVSLGACVFGLISLHLAGDRFDPGRVAAQVVTGIGFLGAGAIIRHGSIVRGLTTAASIWCSASIGLAAGCGWLGLAIAAGCAISLVLWLLRPLSDALSAHREILSVVVRVNDAEALMGVRRELAPHGIALERVAFVSAPEERPIVATLRLHTEAASAAHVMDLLAGVQGIVEAELE